MKAQRFSKTIPILKAEASGDERFVLGIVLEPDVVDAQNDTYSAEEVRKAAHRFMEEFGSLGVMHQLPADGQVKILESYLAPTDFIVGQTAVRKGTWILAVRIVSDDLWQQVQKGELTGFSVGGWAQKLPLVSIEN